MNDQNGRQPGSDMPVEGTTLDGDRTPADGDRADPGFNPAASGSAPGGSAGVAGPVIVPRTKGSQIQDLVDEPAKVMRIGTMLKQLLEEVKSAPLDNAARVRLAEIHERSIRELEDGLAPELAEELERITLPFPEEATPSDSELRVAQAQLVGWLEGLFHGIQTAIAAQHAAREHAMAQVQLRQLPPGTMIAPGVVIGENGEPQRAGAPKPGAEAPQPSEPADPDHGPGQYL